MSRSRGAMLTGPSVMPLAIGLLVAAGLVLIAGLLAPGGRATTARLAATGVAPPGCGRADVPGVRWWRLVPSIGRSGMLAGWTLRLGGQDGGVATLPLPAESVVGGPVGGVVSVAADDGRTSTVGTVSAGGCTTEITERREVVRAVAPDPVGRRLAIHLVDRVSREDLGVRVIDATTGAELSTVVAPGSASLGDAGLERGWRTLIAWDRSGERLVVASCEPRGCLSRIVDAASGRIVAEIAGTADPVALEGDRLVAWDRCSAVPCPLVAVDLAGGGRTVLAADATSARLIGSGAIAMTTAGGPDRVRVVDAEGRAVAQEARVDAGAALLSGPARSDAGVEVPDGWLPLAIEGLDPERAIRAVDGATARLEEVAP